MLGDFCLDRYLDIDPARAEISIETGLPVYNVVEVRSLPGAAGTILNNLVALGVGKIDVIGFCGRDGEGYELQRALHGKQGVQFDGFIDTPLRRTFTYTKPLMLEAGAAAARTEPAGFEKLDADAGGGGAEDCGGAGSSGGLGRRDHGDGSGG